MRLKLLLAVLGLVLLWLPAADIDHARAAYTDACSSFQVSQTAVVRGQGHGFTDNDIRGAIGDAKVRNLNPCGSPSSFLYDLPAVLPANIQNSSGYIVQIGYLECGAPGSATCNGIPSDGNMHFVYICDDQSGGLPCLADGWAGTPVIGRRYRFRVQYNQLGTGKWDYSI